MFKLSQYDNGDNPLEIDKIHLFICASGFETRSTFQALELEGIISKGIVIGFNRHKEQKTRIQNDKEFERIGFKMFQVDEENKNDLTLVKVVETIRKLIFENTYANIYLDYSSMTRNWYSYIIYAIFNIEKRDRINLFMGYSHANYIKRKSQNIQNRIVTPLYGYCNFGIPNKPTSLVIGLGNEVNKVFGLKEYFDAVPFIFHTDKNYNLQYYQESKDILRNVLSQVSEKNIYEFPIHDLIYTYFLLENLCLQLIKDNRVVLAPCGPKPFALLSMLLSLKFDDTLEVWRISAGKDTQVIDRKPTGLMTILNLKFI